MNFSFVLLFTLLSFNTRSNAFVMPQPPQESLIPIGATIDKKRRWKALVSGAMMGWALATQIATASSSTQTLVFEQDLFPAEKLPTITLTQGAYVPESSYEMTDMSLPSYSIKKDSRFDSGASSGDETPLAKTSNLKSPEARAREEAKFKADAENQAAKNKEKAEKEEAKIREYVETQQARAKAKAKQEAIKAKIDAERKAAKEEQARARLEREG